MDTEDSWNDLLNDLALSIECLGVDQAVTVGVRGSARFARVRRLGVDRLRAEAVSNGHLGPADRLDMEALDLLEDLGWQPPTHFADQGEVPRDGSSHHFVDRRFGGPGLDIASVVVRTLRGVFEVATPEALVWRTATHAAAPLDATNPGGPFPPDLSDRDGEVVVDVVLSDVVNGLSSFTSVESIAPVEGTDDVVQVLAGGGTISVLYDPRNLLVRASMPVVTGFPTTAASLLALHDCSRPMRCGRLDLRDGTVYALVDLPAYGPIGDLLVRYLSSITANLDGLRHALVPFTAGV